MKKLVIVTFALLEVGNLGAAPLQQQLEFLTARLRALDAKLEQEAPPPPIPVDDKESEIEKIHKEKSNQPLPPPPAEELPPMPGGKGGKAVQQPPKNVPVPGGTGGVKPQPKPQSDSEEEQENNPPKPPPPPGSGTVVKPIVKPPVVKFVPQLASPLFEKSVKKPVYTPQRKELLAAHEDGNLSAVIGITPEGSLVVYGPVLKQDKPAATQFFQNGRQFMYPNTDQVKFVIDAGKAKAEYAVYELINMPELMAQKKFFDAIEQQIKLMQTRRKDADDLDRALPYVGDLRNLVTAVVTALKNPLLSSAKLHGQLTKESLTIHHIMEVITSLRSLIEQTLVAAEARLKKSEKEKSDKLAEWKSQGTNTDKLLESRWNADKSLSRIKTDLEKLPTIIAQLKAIDLTQLAQLVTELNQQNDNKQRQDLDAYYATLHATGHEPEVAGVSHTEDEDDEVSPSSKLSEAEYAELENLKQEFIANATEWMSASLDPLVEGNLKAKLRRYAVLKKKEDPDWRPASKILGLFTFHQVQY